MKYISLERYPGHIAVRKQSKTEYRHLYMKKFLSQKVDS